MTPHDTLRRERSALAELESATEGDAILEAHRRWLDARRGVQALVHRGHGLPLIHHTPRGEVAYSLEADGRLHVATTPHRSPR
jgi:hypothetical protein